MSSKNSAAARLKVRFGDPIRIDITPAKMSQGEIRDRNVAIFEAFASVAASVLKRPVRESEFFCGELNESEKLSGALK